ncbi:MAG: cytochrome c [Pseudomonadota bacterium]
MSSNSTADNADPNLGLIKARHAEMQLRSFGAGPLFAMAKGDLAYDAEQAADVANNLKTLLEFDIGAAWTPGSDSDNHPGASLAKPATWTHYPKSVELGTQYADAVTALATGDGLGEIRRTIDAVGKSCKACHDAIRAKKKQGGLNAFHRENVRGPVTRL